MRLLCGGRHRYVTVLDNGETGEVLAMVAYRNAAALSGSLIDQGPRWCPSVQVVVSDGSKSYRATIDTHLGHTTHVLDRFHVVRWFAAWLEHWCTPTRSSDSRLEGTNNLLQVLRRVAYGFINRANYQARHIRARGPTPSPQPRPPAAPIPPTRAVS